MPGLAVCLEDGGLAVWDVSGGGQGERVLGPEELDCARCTGVCWPRDADYLVAGTAEGDVCVVQLVDGRALRIAAHLGGVCALQLCARLDPPVFATGGRDGNCLVFRTRPAYAHDSMGRRVASLLDAHAGDGGGNCATHVVGTLAAVRLAAGREDAPPLAAFGTRLAASLCAAVTGVKPEWAEALRRAAPAPAPPEIAVAALAFGFGGVDALDASEREVDGLNWPHNSLAAAAPGAKAARVEVLPPGRALPRVSDGPVRHWEWVACGGGGVVRVCRVFVDVDVN